MLSHDTLVAQLVDRGLLDAGAVVDGELQIVDASRRHHSAQVHARTGRSFVVKRDRAGGAGPGTVRHEAAVYALLERLGADVTAHLPRCFGCDPATGVLVIELLPDTENARERALRGMSADPAVAAAIGDVLARLHVAAARRPAIGADLPGDVPDVALLARPTLSIVHNASPGTAGLMRIVQQTPALAAGLDRLRSEWRRALLIHGDPRWENWLVTSDEVPRVSLIDWEFAGVGDPAWDVGSVVCEYVAFWVRSAPEIPGTTMDQALEHSEVSLEAVQSAIRALWLAYARRRLPVDLDDELLRVTRHTAARLVQLAAEHTHSATEVTAAAGALVQLAANVFSDPRRAASELLGIPAIAALAA